MEPKGVKSNYFGVDMGELNQIQVKFFKEESIFNQIDRESLALYRQMMADRYGNFKEEEE